MNTKLLLAVTSLCAVNFAEAQGDPALNGDWVARFSSLTGRPAQVDLKITDAVGVWQSTTRTPNNPCLGLKYPVSVVNSGTDTVVLTVTGSKAMQGCDDFKLELKRVNATTLEGQFSDGRKVSITR